MRDVASSIAFAFVLFCFFRDGAGKEDKVCTGNEQDGDCSVLDAPKTVVVEEKDDDKEDDDDDDDDDVFATCEYYIPDAIEDYITVVETKSHYQAINFMENPNDGDKCMELDDITQICTNYRPHYHEAFVHFTGAYLERMRRVAFVGGGDAMLLHEVLKYPTVELVVGLELDQKVVRLSHKHFKTQPHFDDERVQWWFGDATKSMRMLPKDYFGSFDLVLVDLSETVMSLPVTRELDILSALALLLKPEGIFVKNEMYFEELQNLFDFTTQLYLPDTPMICDQDWSVGSNGIDFLRPNFNMLRDDGVETLLLKPLEDPDDHYRLIYQYSKNSARLQGQCKEILESDGDDNTSRAGILLIVEAENATQLIKPTAELEDAFFAALEKAGLTPVTLIRLESNHDGDAIAISMREGYVVVHTWPEYNYCGFDINFWGGFERQESARDALLEVVGSKTGTWSSYRIIAGGMIGASTRTEDAKLIGPRALQHRDCSDSSKKITPVDETTMYIAVEESLELVTDRQVAVVVCGERGHKSCKSFDVVWKDKVFKHVIALWACSSTSNDERIDDDGVVTNVSLCEKDIVEEIKSTAKNYGGINALIIDVSAPRHLFSKIYPSWSKSLSEISSMESPFVMIAPVLNNATDSWMRDLLLPMDTDIEWPARKARVRIGNAEINIFTSGDDGFLRRLVDTVDGIKLRSGRSVEISTINPGDYSDQNDYDPHLYEPDDYDPVPGQEQFTNQRPVGYQSLAQLILGESKANAGATKYLSIDRVAVALAQALPQVDFDLFSDMGAGAMFIGMVADGHVVAVWDGDKQLDLNIFSYYGQGVDHKGIIDGVLLSLKKMKVMLLDEMPRGFGRIVNFIEDIDASPGCADNYLICKQKADSGECSEKPDWMMANCQKSCSLCKLDLLKDKYQFAT